MTLVRIDSSCGAAELETQSTGAGPAVMLVAGLGGKGRFWDHQVPTLAERYRVITHDHRGTGGSTRSQIVYSAEQMAEDLVALMDALEIERAHVVGHSTGGAVGQYLALNHPDRVLSLLLSASWAGPNELFMETFRLRRQVLISQGPQAYYLLGSLLASPAERLRPGFLSLAHHLQDRMQDFPGLEIELSRIAAVMSHDLRSHLGRIRVPTLVVGAEDDQLTPSGMQTELAERIPHARLTLLPRGGHFYPINERAAFNELLLGFLGRHA